MAHEQFNHAVPNAPPTSLILSKSTTPSLLLPSATAAAAGRRSTQWPAVAAVAIALIASGVAISSWLTWTAK